MDWIRAHLWETWLIAGVLLGLVEMLSMDLVFAMLALACVVAMVAALVGAPLALQVVIALGAATALLLLLRPPIIARLHNGPDLLTGAEALVGRTARVLEPLDVDRPGRVKIGGDDWTAVPADDSLSVPVGTTVEVVEIRGATAVVRPTDPALPAPDVRKVD